MGLTRTAIRRPLTILMAILALVLMGGVAYTYLQVDRLPPVSIGVVSVSVSWPNASAENVERLVAEPLENAISGVSGVDTITSNSSQGSAQVFVQLVDGYDPNQADIDIQQAMGPVIRQLPTNATAPVVRKFDPNASPILNIAFTGAPLDQLYDIASNQIQPALASVPGVGRVNISGGLQREIQVQVDPNKLAAYNITTQQVSTALTQANVAQPSGSIPVGAQIFNIVPQGLFQTVQDVEHVVVANTTAGPITVGNLATVRQGNKQQFTLQRLNGQDAVGLSITANSDANTVTVSDAVQAEMKRLQSLLPQGTQITIVNDQSKFTRASLDAIQHDLALAVILVALVILVFLHDWKHTIIVLCAIPTSLISTFLVMYLLHFTLNTMSMMALALMIGILVDDSIVVLENIHRHLQLGESPWQAALTGRGEIGMAALAITMADVVVYTPIAFMSGSIGQLFRQYGLTVVAATLFSMLMSFTLTPMLASRWLKHAEGSSRFARLQRLGDAWDRGFDHVGAFFARSVGPVLKGRWLVLLIATAMVLAVGAMIPLRLLGTEYAPAEDNNSFEANLNLPPGTSLDETNRAAQQLERSVAQLPEVTYYFTSVSIPGGTGGGFNRGGASVVQMQIQTVDKSQRTRSVFDLINVLRGQARIIPGANFNGGVQSPLPGGGGGGAGSINMQVSGPDLNTVNQVAEQAQSVLQSVPGIADVRNSSLTSVPEIDITLDSQKMAALGLTNQQVDQALATIIGGQAPTQFQPPGTQAEDITIVAPDANRYDITQLGSIPIGILPATGNSSAPGTPITLAQVATLTPGTGPVTIQRVNRADTVSLTATPAGRPLGDVAADVQSAIKRMQLPPGYSITLRGQVQIFNQAITALGAALVLSVVLEYMLLVALYESWLFPIVRMLTVPLGMVGAFILLLVTGNTINIFSIIGMIMGEGLVAKSGILLVDYANTLRERGMGRTEALREAVRVRLRPILMTSATMIFGMLPLALKLEPGAETRAPMAVVVIGALISSTLLTLVVVPALYTVMDDLQARLFGAQRKPWEVPPPEVALANDLAAEPALAAAGARADGNGHAHAGASNGHDGHGRPHRPADVPLNVLDRGNAYLVRAALPGIKQDDVQVSIHGHTLTIRGQRLPDAQPGERWVMREYATDHWERSMVLPQEVESKDVTASYEDGILELRLPKAGPASRRQVPITSGDGNGRNKWNE
jgi:hydrophobic/amphiphilic exporter-1 (mainly G- bacteria), HAE1 family